MIGGIIGTDIVRYDIYGKDVLIANKMESNGKPGHINVSEIVKDFLEQKLDNVYFFEENQEVHIPNQVETIKSYFIFKNRQ